MQGLLRGCAGLVGLLVLGLGQAQETPVSGESDVSGLQSVTVTRQALVRERVLEGVVEAVNRATISAQTSGRIVEILYDVDDYVPAGSVVLRFRDTEQRAQFKRAQANLSEAEAHDEEATTRYRRSKDVFAKGLISKSAMDADEAAYKAAQAKLAAAKAALAQAREQLDYTRVTAPYAGILTERHVEVGENAKLGQPLVTGVSLERLRVNVQVPQRWVAQVRDTAKARVSLPWTPGESARAEALTFYPYADSLTNTFKVRVDLPAGVKGLFPGMLVKVAFAVGEDRPLLVPAQAVVYRSEVTGVYVVDAKGRIALRQLRLGEERRAGMMEVLAGLEEGERVALDPVRAVFMLKRRVGERTPDNKAEAGHE